MDKHDTLMSIRQVAAYLACGEDTVKRLVRRGELHATRVGPRLRFRRADVELYLARDTGRQRAVGAQVSFGAAIAAQQAVFEDQLAQPGLALLAEAGARLGAALDPALVLAEMARLPVPAFADYCMIYLPNDDGALRLVEVAHTEPARARLIWALEQRHQGLDLRPELLERLFVQGVPVLVPPLVSDRLRMIGSNAELVQQPALDRAATMALPLQARGQVLGLLIWHMATSGRTYTGADLELAGEFADRAAQAFDNARRYAASQEARRRAEQSVSHMNHLLHLTAALAGARSSAQVATVMLDQALAALGAYAGVVMMPANDNTALVAVAQRGYPPGRWDAGRSLPLDAHTPLSDAARTGVPIWIPSRQAYEARYPDLAATLNARTAAITAIPLLIEGCPIGALELSFEARQAFVPVQQALLLALVQQGVQALDRARLYEAERQSADRAGRLQVISAVLSEALTPAQVAWAILEQSRAALKALRGAVGLLQTDGRTIELLHLVNYPRQVIDQYHTFAIDAPLPFAEVVRTGQAICLENGAERAARYPDLQAELGSSHQASITVPLLVDGRPIGALGVTFAEARTFSDDERAFMLALGQLGAQAIARTQLYEAERAARAAAEEAVRLRDVFLSLAAHELKTPLTALLGHVQLIQRRAVNDSSFQERNLRALRVIEAQSQRLNTLISEMLDIARIQTGRLSIDHLPVDLGQLARQVTEEAQPVLGQEHTIVCELPEAPLIIEGDAVRLEQVLHNLLQNAVKYSPEGSAVQMRVMQRGDAAWLVVADQGVGIPQDALPYVFERFYRAENVDERQVSGMGIGLYVVKEIVALHGGNVHVESIEGQGATFTVMLPLSSDPAPLPPEGAKISTAPYPRSHTGERGVWCCDTDAFAE